MSDQSNSEPPQTESSKAEVPPPFGWEDDGGLVAFFEELNAQTDRGAAVMGAAYLEWRIRASIRTRIDVWDEHARHLFGSDMKNGVLDFGDQCKMAYCLGMIGKVSLKDLETIARIRNKFAHHPGVRSFEHEAVRDLAKNLKIPEIMIQKIEAATKGAPGVGKVHPIAGGRNRFIHTVHEIATMVWEAGGHYYKAGKRYDLPAWYW